ncbi:MAG TPA: dihydroorotate dehydrogenase-like protein [Vicinamibacteria bacterium]|nr:dihydroorotate dehydrogenase-like protein [Vicinamibacteria bacterium]
MDLRTRYLGLDLPHPFMPGASPLVDDLDTVKRLEDAGASAIVMHSLFEEQIRREQVATFLHTEMHGESYAEALYYFPRPESFRLGPEEYLAQLGRIKGTVRLPVIASLNGTTLGGWLGYARAMEQAGADALELNVYAVPSAPEDSAADIENRTVEMLRALKAALGIPVAVKLSPFYTSLPHFVGRLETAGLDGLVLFNRFYQPDIDPENLDLNRELRLSSSVELPLRLQWLALLKDRVRCSLAVTGGVHDGRDAVKAVMAGADAVQMVSALLRHGPSHLRRVRDEMIAWMYEHDYTSLAQMKGSMSRASCPDPSVYERANYMLMLQSWERA